MSPAKQRVEIDGRTLAVSNLEKVLFPEVPVTKAQVIDYYVRIAPVLLPHLSGRPVTFTRWPDGVEGQAFFEKNSARHAPDWVRRGAIPSPRRPPRPGGLGVGIPATGGAPGRGGHPAAAGR